MDTNTVVNLIETVSRTLNEQGFEHISLQHEGTTLTLNKRSISGQPTVLSTPAPVAQTASAPVQAPQQTSGNISQEITKDQPASQSEEVAEGNYITIDSPIVGTFYNSPSPDADVFVKVGDTVKKGDVVCIIEAMKLMNEIEAEADGEIAEILVSNEGPVEYGQALFKLKQ